MIFTSHPYYKPNLILSKNITTSDSPELTNTYTKVFKDKMYVIENKEIREVQLKKLSNILYIKRRKYHYNTLCYSLAALLIIKITGNVQELSFLIAIKFVILLLVIIGTYFKTFQYKLIIVQQYEFIELIIPAKYKVAAKTLFVHLKKRITTGQNLL
jgi:hypothetical protein